MSLAYFIVLDAEEPGFDTFVNGKALAHESEHLNAICEQLGIQSFEDYVTVSDETMEEFMEEDFEIPDNDGSEWYEAEEGLALIKALVAYIEENPESVRDAATVREELGEYAVVFEKAKTAGMKWHLEIDL